MAATPNSEDNGARSGMAAQVIGQNLGAEVGLLAIDGGWRTRVRVNIAKTATKGYTTDTTVEIEWTGTEAQPDAVALGRLVEQLERTDRIACEEIARREALDNPWS